MVTWCPAGAASTRWRPGGRNTTVRRSKTQQREWESGRDVTSYMCWGLKTNTVAAQQWPDVSEWSRFKSCFTSFQKCRNEAALQAETLCCKITPSCQHTPEAACCPRTRGCGLFPLGWDDVRMLFCGWTSLYTCWCVCTIADVSERKWNCVTMSSSCFLTATSTRSKVSSAKTVSVNTVIRTDWCVRRK